MPHVILGNSNAIHRVDVDEDGNRVFEELPGDRETHVQIPDLYTRQEALRTIMHADGLWALHSNDPAPAWVESDDDPGLAAAIGIVYDCPVGRPEGWGEDQ